MNEIVMQENDFRKLIIEKEWTTESGLKAQVRMWIHKDKEYALRHWMHDWRCGYIAIPEDHPFYGRSYSGYAVAEEFRNMSIWPENVIDCHGGITFSGKMIFGGKEEWALGFHCNHCDDTEDNWPLHSVMAECELIANQLKEYKE